MVAPGKTSLIISGLPKSTAGALGRHAKRLGMSVDAYLKELIADNLELDRLAQTKSFAELSLPFRKSLEALSERDIDALARRPHVLKSAGKTKR